VELSVIVPTYNEKENIPELIARVEEALRGVPHEVVVVDDNSPDGTAEVAEELGRLYGNVRVVRRPCKMGLASAGLDGVKVAKGEVIAVLDADLQHPPELLPKMLERVKEGYDVVIASRYVKGGGVKGWSLWRKLVSKVATKLAHLVIPESRLVKDPMSGFFMFKRSVLKNASLNPTGYKILLEVLVKGRYSSISEVPYLFEPRKRGKSKLGSKEIINYLKHLLALSGYRPVKFALVGVSGVLVNEGLLHLLVLSGIPVFMASPIAIEFSILSNFTLNDLWTFRDRRVGKILARCLRYHLAVILGAVVNYFILLLLVALGVHYLVANLAGIVAGFMANYVCSEVFVWYKPYSR